MITLGVSLAFLGLALGLAVVGIVMTEQRWKEDNRD